jgi:hypothetical protein
MNVLSCGGEMKGCLACRVSGSNHEHIAIKTTRGLDGGCGVMYAPLFEALVSIDRKPTVPCTGRNDDGSS